MSDSTEHTQILDTRMIDDDPNITRVDDSERLRAEARAARDRQLGKVAQPATPAAPPPVRHKRTTDKFLGSFGLFVLRVVTAGILGVHGYQHITDINGFTSYIAKVGLPSAHYFAWGIGVAEIAAAAAILFGFFTRVAGVGVAALGIGILAKVMWGAANPFQSGVPGFTGELELLLAAVGILLFSLGAGRWSIDAGVRLGRQQSRDGL